MDGSLPLRPESNAVGRLCWIRSAPTIRPYIYIHLVIAVQSSIPSFQVRTMGLGISRTSQIPPVAMVSNGGCQAVELRLSPSCVLKIQRGNITRWSVDGASDAIVNPANDGMVGGGGTDDAILEAGGPKLLAACYDVPEVRPRVRCPTGEARITPGFQLPASRVIHTVGPIYGKDKTPKASLTNAYRNSLRVAKENNIQYVAFTAISCGVYRYPHDKAATVAISTVKKFVKNDFKEVHFVLFSDEIYNVWVKKACELLQK